MAQREAIEKLVYLLGSPEAYRLLKNKLGGSPGTNAPLARSIEMISGESPLYEVQSLDSSPKCLVRRKPVPKTAPMEKSRLQKAANEILAEIFPFDAMTGESDAIWKVKRVVLKTANAVIPVLIQGESGVGKELVALMIHKNGKRFDKPFLAINCGAFPDTLLETELFGYQKNSHSRAHTNKRGLFEQADGGTLFLDEVGECSPAMQVKLLRVLQTGEFRRIGGNKIINADVRIISATNRDLEQMVKSGEFREDLFFRIRGVCIPVPPLRERMEDIPLLTANFFNRHKSKCRGITAEAMQILQHYTYPGNIRELEYAIDAAITMAGWFPVRPRDLPRAFTADIDIENLSCPARDVNVPALVRSLEQAVVGNGDRPFLKNIKAVPSSCILRYLVSTSGKEFTRKDFAEFLEANTANGKGKYKTAKTYLETLIHNRIISHNEKKANKSRFFLRSKFVTGPKNGKFDADSQHLANERLPEKKEERLELRVSERIKRTRIARDFRSNSRRSF